MKLNLLKNFLFITIGVYILLRFISVPLANFGLNVAIIGAVLYLVYRLTFRNSFYKRSIFSVDKKFVAGNNTLANDYCTVIFTPNKMITVMETPKSHRRDKRMFSLTKQQVNINKAWYKLCRIFDYYTNIDLLKEFYENETKVLIVTIENKSAIREEKVKSETNAQAEEKFVELDKVNPDSFGADFGKQNKEGDGFVSMDSLQEQKPTVQRTESEPELTGINDIMNKFGKKINVNSVTAAELSVLPGINIVAAKKIVEYRDLNGKFKTEDDFIKVAKVKEHFIPKIKEMIDVSDLSDGNSKGGYDSDNGRIVDF